MALPFAGRFYADFAEDPQKASRSESDLKPVAMNQLHLKLTINANEESRGHEALRRLPVLSFKYQ